MWSQAQQTPTLLIFKNPDGTPRSLLNLTYTFIHGETLYLFGLFTLDTVTQGTDIEWIGAVSPTRYYDPAAIIVDSEYDIAGGLILVAAALGLLIASAEWFRRRDV